MSHRPESGGLRSMPVVLSHAGVRVAAGGIVGLGLFFFVTGIVLPRIASGRFSLLNLSVRRARRTLPALALAVAATTPFAWAFMLPPQLEDDVPSVAAAQIKTPPHTWSLGIKEWYSVVSPLLLLALWTHSRGRGRGIARCSRPRRSSASGRGTRAISLRASARRTCSS